MSNPKDEYCLLCRGFTNNVRVTHKCPNAGNCEMYCCSVEKFSRMIFIRILTFCCLRTLKNACPLITPHLFNLNNLGLPSSCLLLAPSHAILSSLLLLLRAPSASPVGVKQSSATLEKIALSGKERPPRKDNVSLPQKSGHN